MSSATHPDLRRYGAPALDKGLDIIEHLSNEMAPLSQLEIARALGRTPSQIYRMLMCLEERGYVMREEGSGKFRLTLRYYRFRYTNLLVNGRTLAVRSNLLAFGNFQGSFGAFFLRFHRVELLQRNGVVG